MPPAGMSSNTLNFSRRRDGTCTSCRASSRENQLTCSISADAARTQWRSVADQLRAKFPKLGALMDEAENDVLAFMTFPRAHWAQIYSTNPLERLNAEIKRRTNVVGIFPNDASIMRLVSAVLVETHDEWAVAERRYLSEESMAKIGQPVATVEEATLAITA